MGIYSPKIKSFFSLFSVGILLLGLNVNMACHQFRGLPDRHLHQLPDASELVGIWKVDSNTLQRLRDSYEGLSKTKIDDHALVLRKDGTCSFKTYWDFDSDQNYAISEGTWKLAMLETVAGKGQRGAAVVVNFKAAGAGEVETKFWIARENGILVLWKYIGDPDYTRYADFHQLKQ